MAKQLRGVPGGRPPKPAPRPVPPPLEGNDFVITASLTAAWAVALLIVFLLRNHLPAGGHWWIWTCVAGFGMGLFGLAYVPHLKRSRAKAAARRAERAKHAEQGEQGDSGGRS